MDASILSAPRSTKNKTGKRDPEAPEQEGQSVVFGMKISIGADDLRGAVYSLEKGVHKRDKQKNRRLTGLSPNVPVSANRGITKQLNFRAKSFEFFLLYFCQRPPLVMKHSAFLKYPIYSIRAEML
ncbi:hypothetical protein [Oceanospirillum maris]|uniref:hypothetical protein n=1 Tax=Oceanospirillum maris TaxID=64977 RepID=UPI0004857AEB|nr:hypothetical protein [Oceanospirillum maris]